MAHNMYQNGAAVGYIGRLAAWHELGKVTGKHLSSKELLAEEVFRYVVFKSQLFDGLGRKINAFGTFRWNLADKAANRPDLAEFLGTVGEDYQVIQHHEGFRHLDQLMQTADGAHYETAGVLGNGERVWALADLGLAAKIGDDVQQGYLLFSTGHDGSMAHSYRLCMTRVVCQNTLSAAMSEKTKAKLIVRHTKNAMNRMEDAGEALNAIQGDVKTVEEKLNFLAGRRMVRESLEAILNRLYPKPKKEDGEEKDSTRRTNILADILRNYEANDGNAFPEQRGSAYALLNAITDYTDHSRVSRGDNRAESALFGSGDSLKAKAFELVMESAQSLPALAAATAPRYVTVDAPVAPVVTPKPPVSEGASLLDDVLAGMGLN